MTEFRWLYDNITMRTLLRIQDGSRYIEAYVTDEQLVSAYDLYDLKLQVIQGLCDAWFEKTGEQFYPLPPRNEGEMWSITEVVEGEIVDPEIDPVPEVNRMLRGGSSDHSIDSLLYSLGYGSGEMRANGILYKKRPTSDHVHVEIDPQWSNSVDGDVEERKEIESAERPDS